MRINPIAFFIMFVVSAFQNTLIHIHAAKFVGRYRNSLISPINIVNHAMHTHQSSSFLINNLKSTVKKNIKNIKEYNTNFINRGNCKSLTELNCIVKNKDNKYFKDDEKGKELYLKENDFIKDKKLISISPGGYKGFYMLGTCLFIKENYNLDKYIFSGASAGAWNSLFMSYKGEPLEFILNIMDEAILNKSASIFEMEFLLKMKLLQTYKNEDFDINRLFIGVTTYNKLNFNTNIFTDFDNLEDAVNCCIASSHIPLITGGIFNKYNNMYSFDGGFSEFPYLNIVKPTIHITPSMWDPQQKVLEKPSNVYSKMQSFYNNTSLFSKEKYDLFELFDNGFNDAKKNKEKLDSIFHN